MIIGGMANELFIYEENKMIKTLNGHKKPITAVRLHPNLKTFVSGSEDTNIRIWSENECSSLLRVHHGPITGISIHPTGHPFYNENKKSRIQDAMHLPLRKIPAGLYLIYLQDGQLIRFFKNNFESPLLKKGRIWGIAYFWR